MVFVTPVSAVALPLIEGLFPKWLRIFGKDSNETKYSIPSIYTYVVFLENSVYIKTMQKTVCLHVKHEIIISRLFTFMNDRWKAVRDEEYVFLVQDGSTPGRTPRIMSEYPGRHSLMPGPPSKS